MSKHLSVRSGWEAFLFCSSFSHVFSLPALLKVWLKYLVFSSFPHSASFEHIFKKLL